MSVLEFNDIHRSYQRGEEVLSAIRLHLQHYDREVKGWK